MRHQYDSWEDAMALPEVKCLIQLIHPNVIRLKEVLRGTAMRELYLIFELLFSDLHEMIKDRGKKKQKFEESEIRYIVRSILSGVAYIHKRGFFHRDLKPENILMQGGGAGDKPQVKITDFGLCREISSNPPYTEYISTRWYRAPECILRSRSYSYKMDIFAVGCIMAELYLMKPIFPGTSQFDQWDKICRVLGSPSPEEWPDAERLFPRVASHFKGNRMPFYNKRDLSEIVPYASPEAIEALERMLMFNPKERWSAADLLKTHFFKEQEPSPQQLKWSALPSSRGSKQSQLEILKI